MSDERDMAVQIAVLETEMETMRRDMTEMRSSVKELVDGQQKILDKLNEAKGGWRTLMWLGGAAASAGAGMAWIATHIKFTP